MKYTPVLFATVVLGLSIAAGVAYGAPLTEQQLLKMKAAGISQDLIVQQIQSDGIAFPVDPDAMIALKKAGFSDAVLGALLKAQTGPVAASPMQAAAPDKQPPTAAQVDPCVDMRLNYNFLVFINEQIMTGCEQIAKGDHAYANHCKAHNYSLQKRLLSLPDPNKCMNAADHIFLYDYDDKDLVYAWPPNAVFKTVETLRPNDNQFACGQLQVLTWQLADNVAQMDKSIQQLTGQAQRTNGPSRSVEFYVPIDAVLDCLAAPLDRRRHRQRRPVDRAAATENESRWN
jgi:hypothetical protein